MSWLAAVSVPWAILAITSRWLDPMLDIGGKTAIFFAGVIAVALFGGVAPAVLSGLLSGALLVYFLRNSTKPLIWLPTGMLIGGALGNIIDRLRAGSVTDFIKLPLGWPPFNLADASITIGVVLLVLVVEGPARPEPEPSAERS